MFGFGKRKRELEKTAESVAEKLLAEAIRDVGLQIREVAFDRADPYISPRAIGSVTAGFLSASGVEASP